MFAEPHMGCVPQHHSMSSVSCVVNSAQVWNSNSFPAGFQVSFIGLYRSFQACEPGAAGLETIKVGWRQDPLDNALKPGFGLVE